MSYRAFPARARLRKASEYRAVFANGRKVVCAAFVLVVAPGDEASARLGLALAKRRIVHAVDRNRVKRVVRESFRHVRDQLGAVDIVVLARSRTVTMSNAELFAQLVRVWPDVKRQGMAGGAPTRAGQR